MATQSNQKSDSSNVPQATTTEFPDDVVAMITDLLTRQQQWQQQQSKSEELIARMADQLEQSQRVIQSLASGTTSLPLPAKTAELKTAEHKVPVRNSVDDLPMSWENQKALFMTGHSSDAQAKPASMESALVIVLPAPAHKQPSLDPVVEPVAATVCPRGLSLEARIEHEMGLLENCEPSDRIRWLRARLEDRLRESEIEISIERARIGREKRELDRLRSEFEDEVSRMRGEDTSNNKRSRKDTRDRWSRFLGN